MDILPLCGPREFRLHVESHAASGMQQTAWPQNCTDMWISLHHTKYICTRSSCLADKLKRATWCCLNAELNCTFTPLGCAAHGVKCAWVYSHWACYADPAREDAKKNFKFSSWLQNSLLRLCMNIAQDTLHLALYKHCLQNIALWLHCGCNYM